MSLTVPAITHCYQDGHVGERWGVSTLHRAECISAVYEMKHTDTAEHLAKWLQHIHLHHRRLFVANNDVLLFIVFESEWAHASWFAPRKFVEVLGKECQCGLCILAWWKICWCRKHEMLNIFFRYVVMETNIWLKAFSTVTMMSHNLALCVVKRLYVISTVSYHHLVRHIFKVHHWIRPFLSKKEFEGRGLNSSWKSKILDIYVGSSGLPQCPIFC